MFLVGSLRSLFGIFRHAIQIPSYLKSEINSRILVLLEFRTTKMAACKEHGSVVPVGQ